MENIEKQIINKLKQVDINPEMGNLYNIVLPAMGHSTIDAIADIVDNSLDANANTIQVHLNSTNRGAIEEIWIIDDGSGMDEYSLVESFRFSTNAEHSQGDLGKYGVGGTTGCFTLAQKKETLTKDEDGKVLYGVHDLLGTNDFRMGPASTEQVKMFNDLCPNGTGTIIKLSCLRELDYARAGDLKNKIIAEFKHTFYSYLGQGRDILVFINDKKFQIKGVDPLYSHNKSLIEWEDKKDINYNGQTITLRMVLLKTDLMEPKERSYTKQGVYLNRNGRLIVKGGSVKGLWTSNPRYNSARIEIHFNEESDSDFGLASTKNKVAVKQGLVDALDTDLKFLKNKANTLSRKSSDNTKQSAELKAEESEYAKKLKQHAGVLNLPKSSKVEKPDIKAQRGKGNKKGSVIPKNTGIQRSAKQRIIPQFAHKAMPLNPNHVWYDYGDSDRVEEMIININTSHPFIEQYYSGGSDQTKAALRKTWVANCISLHQHWGETTEGIVQEFRQDVAIQLKKLHNIL